jgi:adenylosuccinate synthase
MAALGEKRNRLNRSKRQGIGDARGWIAYLVRSSLADLLQATRAYILKVETVVGVPIEMIFTEPDRGEKIVSRHLFGSRL